jgi:hypothetical protein
VVEDHTRKPREAEMADSKSTLYCSFCGKSQHEVRKLIAGPTVFICDYCVKLCTDIIHEERIATEIGDILRARFNDQAIEMLSDIKISSLSSGINEFLIHKGGLAWPQDESSISVHAVLRALLDGIEKELAIKTRTQEDLARIAELELLIKDARGKAVAEADKDLSPLIEELQSLKKGERPAEPVTKLPEPEKKPAPVPETKVITESGPAS